jgi:hypothetical protein
MKDVLSSARLPDHTYLTLDNDEHAIDRTARRPQYLIGVEPPHRCTGSKRAPRRRRQPADEWHSGE